MSHLYTRVATAGMNTMEGSNVPYWKSIPSLVALRDDINDLIDSMISLAEKSGISRGHHRNQVRAAVAESPAWSQLGAGRLERDVVADKEEHDMCFGGGTRVSVYSKGGTHTGVRLTRGRVCEPDAHRCGGCI